MSSWYPFARHLFLCKHAFSITYHRSIAKITDIQNNCQTAKWISPEVHVQRIDPYMGFTEYLLGAFENISNISMGMTSKCIGSDELQEGINKLFVDIYALAIFH